MSHQHSAEDVGQGVCVLRFGRAIHGDIGPVLGRWVGRCARCAWAAAADTRAAAWQAFLDHETAEHLDT